jgi:hypothetical protein
MSERDLRQAYEAIIVAVSAADDGALDQLIAPGLIHHNPVPGQAPGRLHVLGLRDARRVSGYSRRGRGYRRGGRQGRGTADIFGALTQKGAIVAPPPRFTGEMEDAS